MLMSLFGHGVVGNVMAGMSRREKLQASHNKYKLIYWILGSIILVGIGVFIGAVLFRNEDGYAMNLFTEGMGVAVSIVITVFVIDRINERRDGERRLDQLQRDLVRDAGSRFRDTSAKALERLRKNEWLTGDNGLLKQADLQNADLQKEYLDNVNLQEASLFEAKLQGARLDRANLSGANLVYAKLQGARMGGANLVGAYLFEAELHWTRLRYSDWPAAESIDQLVTIPPATLPDGKTYTVNTDMGRFTDLSHPEYSATLKIINDIRRKSGLFVVPNWKSDYGA